MFRSNHSISSPDLPPAYFRILPSTDLCVLCASAFSSSSRLTLSLFCKEREKITPLFSRPSALFKKECFDNFLYIRSLRTLLQNTGVAPLLPKSSQSFAVFAGRHSPLATKSRRIRIYEKYVRYPFTIRTSKTQDLKRLCLHPAGAGRCRNR